VRHAGDHRELVVAQRDRQRRRRTVDPHSTEALTEALLRLSSNAELRADLSARGLARPPSSRGRVPRARCSESISARGRFASHHGSGGVCRRRFRAGPILCLPGAFS
jgi:hypothetical protein